MSKKIEDFVPPPELCKRIPEGKFEDSALIYIGGKNTELIVRPRASLTIGDYELLRSGAWEMYPAPTLEEILREMAKNPRYFNNGYCEIDGDGFIVGAHLPNLGNPGSTLVEYRDKNGATAALKLFLHDRRKQ